MPVGWLVLHVALVQGAELVTVLADERIIHLMITVAVLATMPDADLPHLRSLMVGGQALPTDLASRWSAGRRMVNAYGPTETTIFATVTDVSGAGTPGIGTAIPETALYVLDDRLTAVRDGVGELYVGGAGLARVFGSGG